MAKLNCPNCKNNKNLIFLECNACGSITMKCPKCKHAFKIEEGRLVSIKE